MPADFPVTVPVTALTVAIAVLVLLHAPPATASLSFIVSFTHNFNGPVIVTGDESTLTIVVAKHPVPVR